MRVTPSSRRGWRRSTRSIQNASRESRLFMWSLPRRSRDCPRRSAKRSVSGRLQLRLASKQFVKVMEMAPRKKKSLVIVESPAKAKTINKYLGPDYTVLASYGHIRDLPHGRRAKGEAVSGINIDAGWVPRYVVQDKVEGKGRR